MTFAIFLFEKYRLDKKILLYKKCWELFKEYVRIFSEIFEDFWNFWKMANPKKKQNRSKKFWRNSYFVFFE